MGKCHRTWSSDPVAILAGERLIMPYSSDSASYPGSSETGELFFSVKGRCLSSSRPLTFTREVREGTEKNLCGFQDLL